MQTLREEREKFLGFKVTGEKRSQEYLVGARHFSPAFVMSWMEAAQSWVKQNSVKWGIITSKSK